MNTFDKKIQENNRYPLTAEEISTLQVNVGYKCNLRCTHCHVEASPLRKEEMLPEIIAKLLKIIEANKNITTVDITGGAPELNPEFKKFVSGCTDHGKKVLVRTNLAVYAEPGMEGLPGFLAEKKVKLIASLPCYSKEGIDGQRGKGTFDKAIEALKKLNSLGYAQEGTGLELDIMFNPAGAGIAPDQNMLKNAYRDKLRDTHGVVFNNLIALGNMPIGRLGKTMSEDERLEYMKQLIEKFNPDTIDNLMCRHLVSISPDGKIYDCDFWQMLGMTVKGDGAGIDKFDYETLSNREIVTNPLCFMCTAGGGASCGGALA